MQAVTLPLGSMVVILARLAQSEARYRTIFEQADDGILLINAHGLLLEANSALQRRLGYGADEIIGLKAEDILVETVPGLDTAAFERLTNTRSRPRKLRQRCKDGRLLDAEVTVTTLEIDGRTALCYTAQVLTERKDIELESLRNQRHLDHLAHHGSRRADCCRCPASCVLPARYPNIGQHRRNARTGASIHSSSCNHACAPLAAHSRLAHARSLDSAPYQCRGFVQKSLC